MIRFSSVPPTPLCSLFWLWAAGIPVRQPPCAGPSRWAGSLMMARTGRTFPALSVGGRTSSM
eukprot:2815447-Prorocentrum_lima.AAC.1